jgi:hypothetical protein
LSEWNAEATVLLRLIAVFRNYNRFNEEQIVRVRERELHRLTWFAKRFGNVGSQFRWLNPVYMIAWYVEFLLKSVPGFLSAIAAWLFGLTFLYATTTFQRRFDWNFAFQNALVSFFSIQPPGDTSIHFNFFVVALAILGGVLHIGVLISHLYTIVSRR